MRNINSIDKFNVGDMVSFLRQGVGVETKTMIGEIIEFNYSKDFSNKIFWLACIKSDDCEYGRKLPYNNTVAVSGLTLIK